MKLCRRCGVEKPRTEFTSKWCHKMQKSYPYRWCRPCANAHARESGVYRRYYDRHGDKIRARSIAHNRAARMACLERYSNGDIKCICCGERELAFLAIDHIHGGGERHRREIKRSGVTFYRWLVLNEFPEGYQVMCHNCNAAKGHYGSCPHVSINDPIWGEA